jgi:hypothetical protein
MEPLRRPAWWAWVAAMMAIVFLFYETGSWIITALCCTALTGFAIYQTLHREKPASASMYCLKCGEKLNPNARECRACGSASWSYKN